MKDGLDVGGAAHVTAATGGSAVEGAVGGALLRAVLAVDELVLEPAGLSTVLALEDARLHVGNTVAGVDGHVVAGHVDLTGNVDAAPLAEGVLAPGLGDLAVDELGLVVDGGPGTAGTVGEGESLVAAGREGNGDERVVGVDPRSGGAPDDKDNVLIGLVAVLVGVGAVVANPDLGLARGEGVLANGDQAKSKELGLVDGVNQDVALVNVAGGSQYSIPQFRPRAELTRCGPPSRGGGGRGSGC